MVPPELISGSILELIQTLLIQGKVSAANIETKDLLIKEMRRISLKVNCNVENGSL